MKKFLALVLSVIMLSGAAVSVMADESPFTDVKTSRWSYDAIRYAVDKGYMNGVGGGKFDPAGPMTRGMVVTVLYRREGSPEVTFRGDFTDVRAGKYYSDAVIWAKDEGVVNGITETTFEPDGKITREQLATMLSRFSERCPVSVPERADLSGYPDADKIHSYAKDALGWANEANLIKGMSDGTLSPRGYATREQFATILKRFDDTFTLVYNEPVLRSHYTEPEYPLVDDADVYVATDGDDSNPGSFDKPVATFDRAVELVREIKAVKTSGDIVVAFKAGDYGPLSVTLAAEDSGAENQRIVYCKYGDGDVIFNNGFDVKESEFLPLDESEKAIFSANSADKIKKADVSGKLVDYDPKNCLILSESGALNIARFPNVYEDGTDHLMQAGITEDASHIRIYSSLYNRRVAKYHTTEGLIFYGYIVWGWYKDLITTDGYTVDPDTNDYIYYVPHPEEAYGGYGLRYNEESAGGFAYDFYQMALLNVSEELDAPGEYWIDKNTGTFYVYDPHGDYAFTGGDGMITLGRVRNITFLGLDFMNSTEFIINAPEHPQGITIDRCSFTGCGAQNMIDVRGTDRGEPLDLLVTGCSFSTCACTALWVDSVNMDDLFHTGTGVVVDNNYFTLTNLKSSFWSAITVDVPGPLVTHNYFEKCYWTCVGFGNATDMIAEYNVFDRPVCNGDDAGAFGQGIEVWTCGNVIRNNLFMNIKGGTNGRFGVYLDNAIGVEVYSNLFYNVDVSVMNNDISKYNTFCDNVTVRGPEVCDYRFNHTLAVIEAMTSGNEDMILNSSSYRRWVDGFAYFDSHPEVKEEAMSKWPELFTFTTDLSRWQEREFCENSSLVITGNRSFNEKAKQPEFNEVFARYSTIDDNIAYDFSENPLFVNPAIGDYRIRDGADFPDIEFEKMGRY